MMTLTKFMARSAWVAYAFEWGKLLKMSFEEKSQKDIGKWTNIDYSEKRKWASSAPALGLNTIIVKHVYWYMQQISGERLQNHWSSGFHPSLSFF